MAVADRNGHRCHWPSLTTVATADPAAITNSDFNSKARFLEFCGGFEIQLRDPDAWTGESSED
ncbi:hypothetical protein BDN67DRAFT_1016249 [Paxillus ammoniavirescens]|nr:hypothetical protein BDN67DRAFT_1016249 [Paxillus ammoniavirescens]